MHPPRRGGDRGRLDQGGMTTATLSTRRASTTSSGSTASTPTTVGSPSASSTASSWAELSSEQLLIIITSVAGFAVLGLICTLALCFLRTRKNNIKMRKEMAAAKRAALESRTYTGFKEPFEGVAFQRSNHSQIENLLGMQSPGPIYSPRTPRNFGARDTPASPSHYFTTTETSARMLPSDTFPFQPYADEATRTPNMLPNTPLFPSRSFPGRDSNHVPQTVQRHSDSFQRPLTFSRISTVAEISPMTFQDVAPSYSSTVFPQTTINPMYPDLPELGITPRYARHTPARDSLDTMGFPVETSYKFGMNQTPNNDIPIETPVPRNTFLSNQQGVLERAVRDDLNYPTTSSQLSNPALAIARNVGNTYRDVLTPSPTPSLASQLFPVNGSRNFSGVSRVLIADMNLMRESPVLGTRGPPVTISPPSYTRMPSPQPAHRIMENMRKGSVSSDNSVASTMPSVVSNSELERLGVGPRI